MNTAQKVLWLAGEATGGIFYLGWVSAILLAILLISSWLQRHQIGKARKGLLWLFLPLAGIATILISGAVLERKEAFWWISWAGLFLVIVLSCLSVWKFPNGRFFAASICAFLLWFAFWCTFVSVMSITDDWL